MESKGEDTVKGERKPLTFTERCDRVMAAGMPPALAYALGAAAHPYSAPPEVCALLRQEGLMPEDYRWLNDRGEAIVRIFKEAIAAAVPPSRVHVNGCSLDKDHKGLCDPPVANTEPAPPVDAPLEQPATPTFTPDPTPPGTPEIPPAAIGITATDIVGDPSLLEVGRA